MKSVPNTTKFVSLNSAYDDVLDTTLCDKVCRGLATVQWFSPVLWFPPPIKLTHDITEILLKVALNTISAPFIAIAILLCSTLIYQLVTCSNKCTGCQQ